MQHMFTLPLIAAQTALALLTVASQCCSPMCLSIWQAPALTASPLLPPYPPQCWVLHAAQHL